ncbi:hypothetical protein [Aliidiomarina maris]|uniref:hypothetical protein n=1 Tax=Aliidiomarina maris TaxID=531312 RepID=UPI0013003186|nr:hypothetical protein [Aliidiomarina maris]
MSVAIKTKHKRSIMAADVAGNAQQSFNDGEREISEASATLEALAASLQSDCSPP